MLGDGLILVKLKKKSEGVRNVISSIALSANIASRSRVHMSHYIHKYNKSIVYIDTDGIKMTNKLPSREIGKEIGKMKLEGDYTECVCIAPKTYGLKNRKEEIVKIKGYKEVVTFKQLKSVLNKPSIEMKQD